jgi:hypothetical protein
MRHVAACVLVLAALAWWDSSARGADPCRAYRAELARLGSGVDGREVAARVAQLIQYKQSIGCYGSTGFFTSHPPQCNVADQRINALRALSNGEDGSRDRRRELHRLIREYCSKPSEEDTARASGGLQLICVRTCDGGYFPMDWAGKEGSDPDQLCKALCPGTEAAAYSMPPGDDGLKEAAALRSNEPYSALPNAFKFQKEVVAACTCSVKNQGWAQSLAKAEELLPQHKGDVLVTPAIAEQLSRPNINVAAVLAKLSKPAQAASHVKHSYSARVAHSRQRRPPNDFASQEPAVYSGGSVRSYTASPYAPGLFQMGTIQ